MNELKAKLNKLNEDWKIDRNQYKFVYDGILNFDKWNDADLKIMFLLKETADSFYEIAYPGVVIDIRNGNGTHFWWNITYWKHAIYQSYKKQNPEFVMTSQLPEAIENNYILDSIAYVNVKKNCENKSKSSYSEIMDYAMSDSAFLIKQIDLINPQIIVCSQNTFEAYKAIYGIQPISLNDICFRHNNRLLLNFYHPSFFQIKGGRKALFNSLSKALTIDPGLFDDFKWANQSI